ncbi:hypothetical protein SAY86_020630 [Trapa natans]|uniref:histidine kinase n=1 Tax=Trapa natans TaxID=22666 RepID=A0AAN7LMZ5_TRANT|nr:hypothetical protein SAY86_020630 [Trapa natans]
MGTPLLRRAFGCVSGLARPRRNRAAGAASPHDRDRIFSADVKQEDQFQYAKTHCLSSYYSVFVARLAIMVMLAILIGLLTILTWHFTRSYTTKSLNGLAYGLRYELLQRPILRMWNILNSTVEITTAQVKLSEYVIRKYNKPTSQAEQIELYEMMKEVTWALFASRKALNAITINYRNGFVQAFHRDHRSNNTYYIYSDLSNYSITSSGPSSSSEPLSSLRGWNDQSIHGNLSAIWYREPLDPTTGEKIGKARPILPDDLINIAGISQVPDGTATWHVAVSKYSDSPLLSAALPVWDPSRENIVAVVGVTTALYSVGQLMRELVEFHSGHIYLTSQQGYLLATSSNTPLLNNTPKGPKLMMANESQDPVIRAGAEWLKRTYGDNYPPSHEVHVENARLGDQHYYIDSFFLNLKRLPMVGVIIIPRKYVLGKVEERAFKTLIILICASLCILLIGCLCILILTNGVSKEMKLRAELISHLDARRRAEASSNYKSQFLANMSHELRTPMAAVIGLLDILLCDDCLTNEQYSTITQIRKCSTALLRLLNNILDISKVESGKLVLEEAEFDLGRELEGLIDMFSVQCINHDVETILDLSDDMPRLVKGDSARVVQIFANLISNSVKFTTSGHIVVRGWCENLNSINEDTKFSLEHKKPLCALKAKLLKQHGKTIIKRALNLKKDSTAILWFEVDDTGCGIDPSKWESVFESFEQADPSTTRLHGGTGLGLCIVRTLVNKMGGEIKVVKKNGPGTLMKLYLLLNTPTDTPELLHQENFAQHGISVVLALHGGMGRSMMSRWLAKKGVFTIEASDWNGLTQTLQELFHPRRSGSPNSSFRLPYSIVEAEMNLGDRIVAQNLVIVIDIALLDLSTEIWKEQLRFLDRYSRRVKFAWLLNHDTSNAVKVELRRKQHMVMVNKPLYKAKMIHILDTIVKETTMSSSDERISRSVREGEPHECLEMENIPFECVISSDESDTTEAANNAEARGDLQVEVSDQACYGKHIERYDVFNGSEGKFDEGRCEEQGNSSSGNPAPNRGKSLEGLRILLAEDTPVLQRVATIMLEKLGAKVVAVGDGLQAVNSLNCTKSADSKEMNRVMPGLVGTERSPTYDLILMDCQVGSTHLFQALKFLSAKTKKNSFIS